MKQHLIAIDLDGTTLNNQSKLTPTTIKTLQTLSRQGHLVSIVTGRPYLISGHLYDQIGLKTPMINFNGALGHIPHRKWAGEYAVNVTREMTLDLLAHKQELGIKMVIAEDKYHVWADHPSSDLPEFLPAKLAPEQILNEHNLNNDPIALTIQFDPAKKDAILNVVDQKYGDFVEPRVWGGPYSIMELIRRGTHKEAGLRHLVNEYQLSPDQIIAFGDEHNDAEMLSYAGRGVAMKNAVDDIKQIADDVTPLDNDHDGLAKYLQDYFHLDAAKLQLAE